VILACAEARGISWSLPPKSLAWEAFQLFARLHLSPHEMRRYADAITQRLSAGRPAVDPRRVCEVRFPRALSERRHFTRFSASGRLRRLPRDADEFLDQQHQIESARAKRIHVRNQQTERYRRLRALALAAVGYRCERCGGSGRLELHHKHYATLGRESLRDVEMLCRKCHSKETARQRALRRARWRPVSSRGISLWR
jgi:5-methylcytosine-specific restriction endonuclease McrA